MRAVVGSSRAFTLIELILVMLLIAVIVSLAVPLLSRTHDKMQLESSALNIKKLMLYGSQKAVASGRRHRMVFSGDLRRYALEIETGSAAEATTFAALDGRLGRSYRIPDGISLETSHDQVVFYEDGRIEEVEIRLGGRDGRTCFLTTAGTMGCVEIAEETQ